MDDPHRWRAEYGNLAYDEALESWVVVGYRAAREVLVADGWSSDPANSETTRRVLAQLGMSESPLARTMLALDGVDHSRIRDAVRDVFTPRYIAQLTDGVRAIAASVIEPLPSGEPFEFMSEVAQPFPLAVIAEWLALDVDTTRILWDGAGDLVRMLDGFFATEPDLTTATNTFLAVVTEFLPLASDRRDRPGEDLFSVLAEDPRLDLDEVVVNAILLAVAGHETTANLLGSSMIRLLDGSGGERLVDRVDTSDPAVIDELLRLDGPARLLARVALRDQTIEGRTIAAGERVVVGIGAANRDPELFADPDEFRLDRTAAPPHLAFGFGRHRCLGAALARLEAGTALRQIMSRGPELAGPVRMRDTAVVVGPETLPLTFTKVMSHE
ncbi:MAG: cytochrome P450 [Nocardia sp.]|nr:cytochrome P450 [Nocardia sp.]